MAPALPTWAARPVLLTSGHSEIHLAYTAGATAGAPGTWQLSVMDVDNDELLDPANTIIQLKPAGRQAAPAGTSWTALGVSAGAPLWVIPQGNPPPPPNDVVWFGTRSAVTGNPFRPLSGPVFGNGQLALRLVAVEGSGPSAGGVFSLYNTDAFGLPTFRLSTADGLGPQDAVQPINYAAHTHYNWAFTQPGDYRLTFQAYARLREDPGLEVTGVQTFHFQVLAAPPPGRPSPRLAVDGGGVATLRWGSLAGADYTVWRSLDLQRWEIARVLPGTGAELSLALPAESAPAVFYAVPGSGP